MIKKTVKDSLPSVKEKTFLPASGSGRGAAGAGAQSGGQAPISCPLALVNAAVDTLSLTIKGEISERLLASLKEKKASLQETTSDCQYVEFGETTIFSWNLQRTGVKLYPYVLKTGDVSFYLSSRKSNSSLPSLQLNIGSLSCQDNLPELLSSFHRWCKYHQIIIKEEMVSRIDLCADIASPISDHQLWNQAKMITRAEKTAIYYSNRKLSGVQVGAGDIVLRMYDKILELSDKQATHKTEFFQKIWGGVSCLTRVEFQLRRPAVKSLCPGVTDFKTVAGKIPNIWKYLTHKWFRQSAKSVDRLNRNQGRSTTSKFWLVVQSAFDSFTFPPAARNKKKKHININALIEQAAGVMLTVCAAVGHVEDDVFGIMATISETLQSRVFDLMNLPGFAHDFNARAAYALVTF